MLLMIGVFVLSLVFILKLYKKDPDELPGPMALPIIGHLHLIGGKSLHILLREMSYVYGDIFRLKLGSHKAIVLCSRKAIKEAYVKQAKTFASRPDLPTFEYTRHGQVGLSLCKYSSDYKTNTRIAVSAIHNFLANEKNLNDMLTGEAKKLTRLFEKYASSNTSFSPFDDFRLIVPSLFISLMFKQHYDYDDPELNKIVDPYKVWFEVAEADNPADFFPFMLNFPNERLDRVKKCAIAFEDFNMAMIEKFEGACAEEDYDEDKASLFDLILMQYTNRNKTPLTREEKLKLAKIVSDLIGGGFDTSAATLSWAMLLLTNRPEVLKKCRDEIHSVVAGDEELNVNMKNSLPYFSATIYEIFRLSCVAPLGITRQVVKDTTLMGYNIPKDTFVLGNLWQINRDPEIWEEPESLHPEHFLTEDNEIDTIAIRDMQTFSTGIRQCPGKQIAFHMVYMLLGSIIRHYDFNISQKPVDMDPQRGLTLKPKYFTMSLTKTSG